MIDGFFENIFNTLNLFDLFFLTIFLYNIIQCFLKGFSLSLISFMKWIFSTVVTIILVPKLQPVVSEYVESDFEIPKAYIDFQWAMQELRVSLFAQELKTPYPISIKRLDKKWTDLINQ